MTDEHSMESHGDSHDEGMMATDPVYEAPSDHEFADASQENIDETVTQADEEKPARRSPLLPIMAAVGGVLVLGAAAWWQFGGSSAPPPPAAFNNIAPSMAAAPAAAPPPSAMVTPSLPVTPTTNAGTLPTPDMSPSTAEALPIAPAPAPSPMPNPTPAVAPATPPVIVSPSSPTMPTVTAPAAMTPTMSADIKTNNVTLPTPTSFPKPVVTNVATPVVTKPAATADNVQQLASRVDALQRQLDQANTKLGQMTNALAASAQPVPQDTQNRLDAMEQQLAELRRTKASAGVVVSAAPTDTTTYLPRTAHHTSHHIHKATHTSRSKTVETKKKAVTAPAEPSMVLRAASPGQAWVADSATSTDLKQVKVGDTLPGIGRVNAIKAQGDGWVVQGTKGSLQ